MKLTILQLVALAALLVAMMAAATVLVLRGERRDKRVAGRLVLAVMPYARVTALATMGRRHDAPPPLVARAVQGVAGAFGYDPARADQLPCPALTVLVAASVAGLGACVLLSLLVGPAALLGAPIAGLLASRFVFGWLAGRQAAKLYVQFPDALAMIVRSVRVGTPVSEAIRAVSREAPAPTAVEFGRLSDQVAIGVALEDALRDLAARNGLPEYRFFATALALQAQTGGALTETLENLADVIRKRVAMRARGHALASEARTSTYVLAALPVVTGCALGVVNPSYISLLFTEPMGNKILGGAIVMLTVGMGVMRLIISRSLR